MYTYIYIYIHITYYILHTYIYIYYVYILYTTLCNPLQIIFPMMPMEISAAVDTAAGDLTDPGLDP